MALWQYASTEETTNSCRVSRVLIDPCTDQMRDVLRHHIPPTNFPQVIRQQKHKLPKLTRPQFDLILPRSGYYTGNYSDFDISLSYTLLRNICNIPAHSKGWGKDPDPNDMSLSANIERIRNARNTAVGHMTSSSLSNTDFNAIWSTIRTAVVEIDTFLNNNQKYEKAVDFLQNETMDPLKDKEYERKLHDQVKEDIETREMIEKTKQTIEDQEARFEQFRIASSVRQDKTETDIQRHDAEILDMKQQTDKLIAGQDKTDSHIKRHDAEILNMKQQTDELIVGQDKTDTDIQKYDAEILSMKQQTDELTARQDKIDAELLYRKKEWVDHKTTTASIQDQQDKMRADIENLKQQKEKKVEPNVSELKQRLLEEALLIPLSEVTEDSDTLPVEHLFSSVVIKEDAKQNRNGGKKAHDTENQEVEKVQSPDDMLTKDGKPVPNVFMLGKAAHGKTTYCKWLLKLWCRTQQTESRSHLLDRWEKGLSQFDFVFHIPLRHVDPSRANVTNMICQDILGNDTDLCETAQHVLSSNEYRCFIMMDGLDEWKPDQSVIDRLKYKGMPNMDNMSNCVIFTTMRPWKFSEVAGVLRNNARVIEIQGLDDKGIESVIEKVLVNYYKLESDTVEYKAKHKEIIRNLENATLKSFIKIPLLAVVCVQIWYEGEQVGDGMTSFYIAMVNMLIQRAHLKHDTQKLIFESSNVSLPKLFFAKKNIRNYFNVLLKLGKVAFEGLLSEEMTLVFQIDDLESELGERELQFSLDVGLISQKDVHSVTERKVSVQFFHKSVQEFLAAIYIVTHKEMGNSFCEHLFDIKVIMMLSNVIMFICGMCPSLGSVISQRVVSVTDSDIKISTYREFPDCNSTVEELYKLQVGWYRELEYGQTDSPVTDSPVTFHVSDLDLRALSDTETVRVTRELLSVRKVDIRSLTLFCAPTDREHGITNTVINNFLCSSYHTRSLTMVLINGHNTDRCINMICGPALRTLRLLGITVPDSITGSKPLLFDCNMLQRLYFEDIALGERNIGLTSRMSMLERIDLVRVNMTASVWGRWLQSVINIHNRFDVRMEDTNIDRYTRSIIHSSPHFNVTWNRNERLLLFTRIWPMTQRRCALL